MQTPLEQAEHSKAVGNKYFKGKKYDSALRCYEEAIKLCPPDQTVALATYHQNMAACYELMVTNGYCLVVVMITLALGNK